MKKLLMCLLLSVFSYCSCPSPVHAASMRWSPKQLKGQYRCAAWGSDTKGISHRLEAYLGFDGVHVVGGFYRRDWPDGRERELQMVAGEYVVHDDGEVSVHWDVIPFGRFLEGHLVQSGKGIVITEGGTYLLSGSCWREK